MAMDRILQTDRAASYAYSVTVQRGERFTGMLLVQGRQALGIPYEGHGCWR